MLTIGEWRVDASAHQISRDRTTRKLEPRVMDVLVLLAQRAGSVVTRTELMTQVWGDTFITDDAVSAAIIKLRRAFDDDARRPRVIETVPKSGYRLIAEVADDERDKHRSAPTQRGIRSATVLRCELDLATPTGGTATAETWERALAELRDRIVRLVNTHERTVTITMEPTAIIAVFGAPVASEHHALRAVTMALDLRSGTSLVNSTPAVSRIGIASGEVLTSPLGVDATSAVGPPMAHAAALAAMAAPGDVLVSTSTRDLLSPDIGLDAVTTAATTSEIAAFRVVGRRPPLSDWPQHSATTPLVGRSVERATLDAALEAATHGNGGSCVVRGPAGVGKTRLVADVAETARTASMRVWAGFASPLDRHTPYAPVRAMLSAAFTTTSVSDDVALAALLGADAGEGAWSTADADERAARVTTVVEQLLVPDDRPTLIVVEDLHWADDATRALLTALASRLRRHRCLLVVTTRGDDAGMDVHPFAARAPVLRLRPLLPPDASSLLTALVGADPSLASWRSEILDRTAGTPLFLRECVAAAVTAGALIGEAGSYVLDPSVSLPPVPASLRGLLSERIDRLSPRARSIAEAAALIGREPDAALLADVIQRPEAERSAALTELDAAGILEPSGTRAMPSYVFSHALIQEAAALGLPSDQRRGIHRRIAEALGRVGPGASAPVPEVLAHHWTEAGDAEHAIPCWLAAAGNAARSGAHDDALRHLERAEELAADLADAKLRRRYELTIALARGSSLVQTVGPTDDAVLRAYERADALAVSDTPSAERFQAVWGRWLVHMMRGNVTPLAPLADDLFTLASDLGDEALLLEAHHVQWSGLILAGRPEEARRHTAVVIERYDPELHHWLTYSYGGHDPGVCALNLNAMTCWLAGDRDSAATMSQRARDLATALDHGYTLLESMQTALTVALVERDADRLDALTSQLDQLVDEGRLPPLTSGFADGFRGAALAARGEVESAAVLMRAACPVWREFWGAWCHPLDVAYAEVLAGVGDPDAARRHLEQVLESARASGAVWWEDRLVGALDALS